MFSNVEFAIFVTDSLLSVRPLIVLYTIISILNLNTQCSLPGY